MTADQRAHLVDLAREFYAASAERSDAAFMAFYKACGERGLLEVERDTIMDEAEDWWEEQVARGAKERP